MAQSQESAEMIAIQALGWLAADDELMPVFLSASGADVADLRNQSRDPAFLGAVLDFLLMNDAWVVGFCEHAKLKYDAPMRARAALPGGEQVNWT